MPSRKIHRHTSKLFFGKPYDEVHQALDHPVKYLGRSHRVLFHNPADAVTIGYKVAGVEGAFAALLHLTIDHIFSTNKTIAKTYHLLRQAQQKK